MINWVVLPICSARRSGYTLMKMTNLTLNFSMFRTNAQLTRLHNWMPIVQPGSPMCNPTVSASRLHNGVALELSGYATGLSSRCPIVQWG